MKSTDDVSRKRAELGCCRTGHSESDVALSELAETLHKKFQKECKLDELKEAVAPHHSAEALRPPGNKKQSLSLGKLAIFLSDEYGNRRVVAGLKDAVTLGRATSELHLLGHLDRGPSHHNPRDFRARFRKEADMRDLEGAIELHRAALELRPSGHPRRFSSLQNLALCLSDRYEDQGLNTDLEEATMLNNAARPPCPAGHPDRDTFLHNLLCDLTTRFKKPTDMRGLEEAIELHHAALELRPSGHPRWFSSLRKLSRCLLTRYGNLGVVADLQEVVALGRTALEFYPPGHPDYGTFLHDLACTLRTRFKEQTDIRDLQDAIELHRLALEIRLSGHPDRSSSLQNLALCLSDRYDNAGVVDDLAEAVTLGREALGLRPPGHPNRDISLHDLACNFKTRFEKQVTMEDLEEAIALHRAALELRPSGHPLRFSSLQNLALCLSDRYDNLRVVADSAATTSDRAARTLHSPQHPDRGTADLDEAFALLREALRLLVPGDRHYDISQQCLPARLQMKFEVEQGSPSGGDSIVDLESRFDDTASEQTAFSVASTTDISIDESDIVVGVIGPTGSGKSTFIDRAVGRPDTDAGHDLTLCTREVRAVRYPLTDGVRNIVLVDTPGFDDTFMTDVQILQRIAHWLKSTYEKGIKLTGILHLHRISDNRVGGTPLRNYKMFKELCGKDNFKNVLLVTTMWDEVAEEAGSAREQELHADFWQAMIALGSTIHRFEGTTESAWKIIDSLSVPPLASHCPLHGAVLSQLISVLRASLVTVELVRIHCLKNAIAPSLSLALFMETTAGTHHAFFQVVEVATLLINVVMGHAKVVKLSADVKNAINAFAKEMNSVQGIIQSVAQRKPEMRHVLEPIDASIISSCASSMWLVCGVLWSTPSTKHRLRSIGGALAGSYTSLPLGV